MAPKTKEQVLALNARELIEEIEKTTDTELLDDIELAELQREDESKGSGRKTVFAALKARREELSSGDDRRSVNQDGAIENAFAAGKLPGEDRRQIRVRAKDRGFYGGQRYRPGQTFTIARESEFGSWMERLGDEPPEKAAAEPTIEEVPASDDSSVL